MDALVTVLGQLERVDAEAGDRKKAIEPVELACDFLRDLGDLREILQIALVPLNLAVLLATLRAVVALRAEARLVVVRCLVKVARLDVCNRGVGRRLLRAEEDNASAVRVQRARDREADAVGSCETRSELARYDTRKERGAHRQ